MNDKTLNENKTNIQKEADMALDTKKSPEAATMTAKDAFFDKLETYFDFRDADPERFNPTALENLKQNLIQMCGAVRNVREQVRDPNYQTMIALIVGTENPSVKEWVRCGFPLNEGARMLGYTLKKMARLLEGRTHDDSKSSSFNAVRRGSFKLSL